MRAIVALALAVALAGCETTGAARRAYVRAGTGVVTEDFEEVVTTSEDGRTRTTRSRRVTSSYGSPALDALKALGGVAGKAAR